jgi:hypothetical protein
MLPLIDPAMLQANVMPFNASRLFLKQILYNDPLRKLEHEHRLGHSSYMGMFYGLVFNSSAFSSRYITPLSYNQRKALSERFHPPALKGRFTGHLDGTHCRTWLWLSRGEDPKCNYSFKFKGAGLNTQALLLPDLTVGMLSLLSLSILVFSHY